MRPIDADAVIKNLGDIVASKNRFGRGIEAGISNAILRLENASTLTLDDLRPKGRWNPLPEDDREQMIGDQCSLCGYEHFGSRFNFCPNCGADMRGE